MLDQFNQLYSNIGVIYFLNTSNAYFIKLTVEKNLYSLFNFLLITLFY